MSSKRYFGGRFPILNACISMLIFWGLAHRRAQLLKRNLRNAAHANVVTKNEERVKTEFSKFLGQGFDKINVGGGNKNLEGFLNIDFLPHPGVKFELIANILDLSFIPDLSIFHIHSNHVVEHITQAEFELQLREYRRILFPKGIITIRCPNVLGVSYGFFHGMEAESEYTEFLSLGYPKEEEFYNPMDEWYCRDLYAFFHWVWGDVGNIANQHPNQFTPTKMKNSLESAGFRILKMTEPETSNLVLVACRED